MSHESRRHLLRKQRAHPQTPGFGLPTGPPRSEWSGAGMRQVAVVGEPHDCFSTQEILRLTTRSSLFQETELHLLGGLASGCATCWAAVGKARSRLKFQGATGPEIELLRTLTLYPPKAQPIALRQAAEGARKGGVAGVLALLVESAALLCWEEPHRLLGELEYIRALMGRGEVAGWVGLNSRIDMYCARAWLRVQDVDRKEKRQRASVALEASLIQARVNMARGAGGAAELLATALAARSELEPARTEEYLAAAIGLLPAGNPLRSELLCELAAFLVEQEPEAALETLLQASAESEHLGEEFPELCLDILHFAAATATRLAQLAGGLGPFACLYSALAVEAHALSQAQLDTYPFAKKTLKASILNLDLRQMVAFGEPPSLDELEERWRGLLLEERGAGMKALELLWLATSQGFQEFVERYVVRAQSRWRFSCSGMMDRALKLQRVASGSALDRRVLLPFVELLGRLETAH